MSFFNFAARVRSYRITSHRGSFYLPGSLDRHRYTLFCFLIFLSYFFFWFLFQKSLESYKRPSNASCECSKLRTRRSTALRDCSCRWTTFLLWYARWAIKTHRSNVFDIRNITYRNIKQEHILNFSANDNRAVVEHCRTEPNTMLQDEMKYLSLDILIRFVNEQF